MYRYFLFPILTMLLLMFGGCSPEAGEASIFLPSTTYEETDTAIVTPSPAAAENTPEEPVILTLAVQGYEVEDGVFEANNLWTEIITEFNGSQCGIQIETKVYPTDDTQLRLELISGEGPDLILTGSFDNAGVLTAMGALLDLSPYLDADPDCSREDFLNLDLLELDGKLTQVCPQYYITTYYGTEASYGTESGWTLQECLDRLLSANSPQDILGNITGSSFMASMIRAYAGEYVDYENALVDSVNRNQENPQSLMAAAALGGTVTPKFTSEEAELLEYLLFGGPTLYGYDSVVSPIVLEEMDRYLAGEKTQDEVISLIENRLNIYLSEIQR